MRHEVGAELKVDSGNGGEEAGDLIGAGGEAGSEAVLVKGRVDVEHLLVLQLLKVLHGEFQHIGLLQFVEVGSFGFGLKCEDHEVLEFVEALVDPGPALAFEQGLHHLPVLVRPGHGRDGGVMVDLVKVESGVEDGSHG